MLEAKTFRKYVRECVDSDAYRHRFRVRELSAIDRDYRFSVHRPIPLTQVLLAMFVVGIGSLFDCLDNRLILSKKRRLS